MPKKHHAKKEEDGMMFEMDDLLHGSGEETPVENVYKAPSDTKEAWASPHTSPRPCSLA